MWAMLQDNFTAREIRGKQNLQDKTDLREQRPNAMNEPCLDPDGNKWNHKKNIYKTTGKCEN